MPHLEHLKAKPGKIIRSADWNELVDEVQSLRELVAVPMGYLPYGAVSYGDVYPAQDLVLKLGLPTHRWAEVHGGFGYFTYGVKVGGGTVKITELEARKLQWLFDNFDRIVEAVGGPRL